MSLLDQYIRRATAGLPSRTRLDAAAELRVHLNQRVQQHLDEGFERAEAEHLALQQMGPAEPVNRSFLGHVFTPRLGWALVVALLLGSGGWLAGNHLFAPAAIAKPRTLTAEELMPVFGDFASVELTLPRGVRLLQGAAAQGPAPMYSWGNNLTERAAGLRPNQRITLPLTFGFLNPGLATVACAEGSRPWISAEGLGGMSQSCIELPSEQGGWLHLTQDGLEIAYDTWQPLFLYRPSVTVDSVEEGTRILSHGSQGYQITADPDMWIVLSVYASRNALGETGPLPPAPTVPDVIRQYPWLSRL